MDVEGVVRPIAEGMGDRVLFIGGIAVERYAPYRRTQGIDLVVRERDFHALKALLTQAGFAHRESARLRKHTFKGQEVGEVDVYTTAIGEVPVDEGLFRRACTLSYGGVSMSVASLEDLLRLKLLAGREMDLADAAVLLHARGDEVDSALLEEMVPVDVLRRAAATIPDLLPEEYGWQARRKLKAWLRGRGWLPRGS